LLYVQKPEKSLGFFLIWFYPATGITLNSTELSFTNLWSKYFSSPSFMSGIYFGFNSFFIKSSMSKSAKNGCYKISSIPFSAPSLFSFFLASSLLIRSWAFGDTYMLCFSGSGKVTLASWIKKNIWCLFLWKKGGIPTNIS